ncbi:MAG: hypothetical protein HQL88_06730 [Magnetococcales bacterium]|nr:hypothetical protein [Magnetococcales bacterium]
MLLYAVAALHGLMGMGPPLNKETDQREQYPLKEGVLLPEVVVAAPKIIVPKKPQVIVLDKSRKSSWLGPLRERW